MLPKSARAGHVGFERESLGVGMVSDRCSLKRGAFADQCVQSGVGHLRVLARLLDQEHIACDAEDARSYCLDSCISVDLLNKVEPVQTEQDLYT